MASMRPVSEWDEAYILQLPHGDFDWIEFKGRRAMDFSIDGVDEKRVLENLSMQISAFPRIEPSFSEEIPPEPMICELNVPTIDIGCICEPVNVVSRIAWTANHCQSGGGSNSKGERILPRSGSAASERVREPSGRVCHFSAGKSSNQPHGSKEWHIAPTTAAA